MQLYYIKAINILEKIHRRCIYTRHYLFHFQLSSFSIDFNHFLTHIARYQREILFLREKLTVISY